jgi:hypothetical protein
MRGASLLAPGAEFVESLQEFGFSATIDGLIILFGDAKVILIDPAFRGVMGVLIALTVAQPCGSGVVSVTEVHRYGQDGILTDIAKRRVDGDVGGV